MLFLRPFVDNFCSLYTIIKCFLQERKRKLSTPITASSRQLSSPSEKNPHGELISRLKRLCGKPESRSTMLSYTDLKKGTLFVMDNDPYEVLESNFSRMQQRKAVVQTKIRNLASGKIFDVTFQASDQFKEANVQKRTLLFLYRHRGEYVFSDPEIPKNRFSLKEEIIGDKKNWLKPNTEVSALFFDEKFLSLTIPIKMDLKVSEAPPGIQGDRAQGGTKAITLETGATIQAPLFIHTGDTIRINTETGLYVERVTKA